MGANPETMTTDDPEVLRADIERRRAELGGTLDAIGDRVSPGRIIERRRNRMSDGVRTMRERVMGTVGDASNRASESAGSMTESVKDAVGPDAMRAQATGRPLVAGLVSFGVGFLAAAALPKTEAEGRAAQTLMDKAEPLTDELKEAGREIADDLKQEATQAGRQVADRASDAASSVSDTAKQEAAAVKDEVGSSSGSAGPAGGTGSPTSAP